MNELTLARDIAEGALPSPQEFLGSFYWMLRISAPESRGGRVSESTAYMTLPCGSAKKCSADFGLPVVMEHPDAGMLNSVEFAARAVGMVVYSFVRDSDLMGVARILDAAAIEILKEGADTSPAVEFAPDTGARIAIDDKPLLIEGVPMLLDHVALVGRGEGRSAGLR